LSKSFFPALFVFVILCGVTVFKTNLQQSYYQMTGTLVPGTQLTFAMVQPLPGEIGGTEAGSSEAGSVEALNPVALQERKEKATKVATTLIILISFTGAFLICWVLLYGRYLKKRAKVRSCDIEPPEQFWYLKHQSPEGKPEQSEAEPSESTPPDDDKDSTA